MGLGVAIVAQAYTWIDAYKIKIEQLHVISVLPIKLSIYI